MGIPTSDYQSDRWVMSVSIKPARCKKSTLRMGFSGHAAEPAPSKYNLDRTLLDSQETKRLLGTPVIAPEGILKEERATAMFRSSGEFPYRLRVPIEEKIRIGKELNRKPDTLKTTRAGGLTWMASNPELPYQPNNILDASYIRSELKWLKDGAFIQPEKGR